MSDVEILLRMNDIFEVQLIISDIDLEISLLIGQSSNIGSPTDLLVVKEPGFGS